MHGLKTMGMLEEQDGASSKALFLVAVFAFSFVLLYLSTTNEHQQQFLLANGNSLYNDANTMIKQVQVSHGFLKISVDLGLELPEKMRNIPIDAIVHNWNASTIIPPKLRYFKQQLRGMRVRLNVYFHDDGINCSTATENTLGGRWSHANQLHIFLPSHNDDTCEAMFQGQRMELADFKWEILDGSVLAHKLDVRQIGGKIRTGVELNAVGSMDAIPSNLFLIPVPESHNNSSKKPLTVFTRVGFWATNNQDLPKQVGIVIASQLENITEQEEATFIIHSVQWRTVGVAEWFDASYRHVELKLDPSIEIKESNAFIGMFVTSHSIRSINMDSAREYFKLIRPITQDHFTRSLVVKMQRVVGSMPMFNLL